jgi:hypothetical protein
VLPLRLPLDRRLESIREALATTREQSMTTRDRFSAADVSVFPRSRILRFDD